MGATSKSKRSRWGEVVRKTQKRSEPYGLVSLCPPHAKENGKKRPRSDKHKNKRG